jgi:flagellar basal body-associated protein FliL
MKKGQSSMVATVLLIMAAIVTGILVTSFSQKSTDKVTDKITEIGTGIECNDIRLSFKFDEDTNTLYVKNRGTLGVDQIIFRKYDSSDEITTDTVEDFDGNNKLLPSVEYEYGSMDGVERVEAKPIYKDEDEGLIGCNEVVREF